MTETKLRSWAKDAETHNYVQVLSDAFRMPGVISVLRPVQAASLVEMAHNGGLFGPQAMGAGVFLSAVLSVLVAEGRRPVMLVPANLQEKLRRDLNAWRMSWHIPVNISVISFEELTSAKQNYRLEYAQPDLIVTPDCSRLKNLNSKATQLVAEYMKEKPETKFVAFTTNVDAFDDYMHVLRWCLKDKTPVQAEGESRSNFRARLLQTSGIVGLLGTETFESTPISDVLVGAGLAKTVGQARTFLQQSAVEVDGVQVHGEFKLSPGVHTIQVGSRAWAKVTLGENTETVGKPS